MMARTFINIGQDGLNIPFISIKYKTDLLWLQAPKLPFLRAYT